jgi:two-component system, LytTR family, response regulator
MGRQLVHLYYYQYLCAMKQTKMNQTLARVVIVDDESHAVAGLRAMLSKDNRIDVLAGISNPKEAVAFILDNKPDLVFLDIQMPGMNGFDVIKALKEEHVSPAVIFVTAYDRFAIDAIRLAAFDYLLKPIDTKELERCIDRYFSVVAREEQTTRYINLLESMNPGRKVKFTTSGGFLMINMNDILYIQADWNYAKIYLSKNHAETLTMNLGAVEKILPATMFMRINRSVIVNLNHLYRVKRIARQCVLIKDDVEYAFPIPISRIRQLEKML